MARPDELMALANRLAGFDETPADSAIVHDSGEPITKALASINATTGDLLLAKQLGCDAFLLHHPLAGPSRRNFHRVLDRMIELLTEHGVPDRAARDATASLRTRLRFHDHAADWDHLASAARLLNITLLNIHLAADELGRREMERAVAQAPPEATVEQVVHALQTIPELAAPSNEVLHVPAGPSGRAGRVAVMHAGGTNAGADGAEALFDTTAADERGPVRTVVYIHLSGEDAKRIEQRAQQSAPGTVIVTGHLASDAIGMNILIQNATRELGLEIIEHGGLTPFPRRTTDGNQP
jgi:putative NIF3 family GTP cyclohydrolase 1 type 2